MTRKPVAADFFITEDDPGTPEARQTLIRDAMEKMNGHGVAKVRVTLTGPDVEGDKSGYPPGLWFEGWKDADAEQLPFGCSEKPGGPLYPPLTEAAS